MLTVTRASSVETDCSELEVTVFSRCEEASAVCSRTASSTALATDSVPEV